MTLVETQVTISIDGQDIQVPQGGTVLDACTAAGVDTPTLCYAENLTPVNACRVCVVEVEGSRTLVPSCSRQAEEGMVVQTDSERVRHSRKMVLEFLGSGRRHEPGRRARPHGDLRADPERFGADAARDQREP